MLAVLTLLLAVAAQAEWRLIFDEDLRGVDSDDVAWSAVAPSSTTALDDGGEFFRVHGGPEFDRQLASFTLHRKRVAFGEDGWLTAELAARDLGTRPAPSLQRGRISIPDHYGALIVRNTRRLPAEYRVEVELRDIEFGGWGDEGNGYSAGKKTPDPWSWGAPPAEWPDIRGANGFYLLAIVDHDDPAPRNNVFIHTRRKAVIDVYNVTEGGFEACDPKTRTFYTGGRNTVNAFFAIPGTELDSMAVMKTECGTIYGGQDGRSPYVAAAQLLRGERYRFAIERSSAAFTLELAGRFRGIGRRTLRYSRGFVEDGVPIWHHDSAYPDSFILGDPHLNFYEGTARIARIRLLQPAR
ncbi:MAG: hypothetical protein HY553_18395 [Elusimicrobia bacterium]|nr:hypothetical protein [Elusimicrobiota bacterium]